MNCIQTKALIVMVYWRAKCL